MFKGACVGEGEHRGSVLLIATAGVQAVAAGSTCRGRGHQYSDLVLSIATAGVQAGAQGGTRGGGCERSGSVLPTANAVQAGAQGRSSAPSAAVGVRASGTRELAWGKEA